MLTSLPGGMQFFSEPHSHPSHSPPGDPFLETVGPSPLPPAASIDLGMLHHLNLNPSPHPHHFPLDHQQHGGPASCRGMLHSALSCDVDGHLSFSQEDLRRILDVTDYAQRERAMLLQALEGLSLNEQRLPPSPPPLAPGIFQDQPEAAGSLGQPRLLRDEGGLFRLVPTERSSSPPVDVRVRGSLAPQCLFKREGEEEDFESDHFRMFRFKVQLCRESRCHDWAQCPFAHPGEKASRRDPRVYRYSAVPCPDVKRSGKCSRGDACAMAHGVFECWLHPSRYRTQPCKDGPKCHRKVCFFAHANEQLRLAPAAAAAAAADAVAAAAAAAVAVRKGPSQGCHSPPKFSRRKQLQLQPGAASPPSKSASPSSILSPISTSPPPSPQTRGCVATPFSLRDSPALERNWSPQPEHMYADYGNVPPFFPQPYGRGCMNLVAPQLPEQNGCGVPFLSRPALMPGVAAHAADYHAAQVGPGSDVFQMNFAQPSWGFDQLPCAEISGHSGLAVSAASAGSLVQEEEPDLTWVSELIQDQ